MVKRTEMVRKLVSITKRQDAAIKGKADKLEISFADALRRVLDEYLENSEG